MILILVGLLFVAGVFAVLGFGLYLVRPADESASDQLVVIQAGMSLNRVAEALQERDIIASKELFMLWARLMGASKQIKSGEYRLSGRMPPVEVLEILTTGRIISHPVTIPEGLNRVQIAELLDKRGLVNKDDFLDLTENPGVVRQYGLSGPTLEGYLYPDTYFFGRGVAPALIVDTMVRRFQQVFSPLKKKAEELDMSVEKIITLASIVEKETGQGKERPLIASVFLNRLKKKMRLESDPTVIYGMKAFSGNLKKKDLATPSPYNTYVIRGLPPGPIANPGLASIRAVLYPAKTDYLYFVSKNDGTHYFSRTLIEHNRAVNKYQRKRRRSRRKST
ncbi:MAG: endolytic transglycosylase MltG [Deltaproteobacteria bacterium]|nr:endolytic transglycosylase MltG [Deltaproteobacteria bacterium]